MLSSNEQATIRQRLEREPNETELHVFDAMWSEHCSYKSSKRWLKQLHTTGECVIHGPGENAGVVDIGDGDKLVFKIESHNHPSFIEPFEGAATGAGGILRDVFTMNARPIALLNSLHFGREATPKTLEVVKGVVAGIGNYGNCIGVPTVSSKVYHHECYEANPLVNAMAVGWTNQDVFTSVAGKKGLVIYAGAKTGRDGIGGAIMASETFGDDTEAKSPAVQVGDPFLEKLLLEASLELFATGKVIAAQDMGAAGILSSTTEIAQKSGFGIEIWADNVPKREMGMAPWEILLSESQERMLFVVEDDPDIQKIFDKWDLDYKVIGELIDEPVFKVAYFGDCVCNIPLAALEAPEINGSASRSEKTDISKVEPFLVGEEWVWEQYDQDVMGNTIRGLRHDPAIVRIPGSKKAIAMSTFSNADLVGCDPSLGATTTIIQAWSAMKFAGAKPLAITNCMNFASPEDPETMHDFSRTVLAMASICKHLDLPVVSGNVSFYNETDGKGILPTPVIGIVGLIENYEDEDSSNRIPW